MPLAVDPAIEARKATPAGTSLDAAYVVLSVFAHRLVGGPYGHAPMAAEALEALGMGSAITEYINRQLASGALVSRTKLKTPIDPARPAFGDEDRESDWAQFFGKEIAEHGVEETVRIWLPVLTPTAYSAAGHALIRVGHALRAVERHDSPARRSEVARALGSWACMHHTPRLSLSDPRPGKPPADALAQFPVAEAPAGTETISGGIGAAFRLPGFEAAVCEVDLSAPGAADAVLSLFAEVFLEDAASPFTAMALCHAVTVSAAARTVGQWLCPADAEALLRVAFATGAAIRSGFYGLHGGEDPGPDDTPAPSLLTARCVELGADHAIKFTETCVSAYGRTRNPIFLTAAARGLVLLGDD